MANKDLKRENAKLDAAHGSTGGRPNYSWEFSENLFFPFRKEPLEYDYVANEAGIIEARPVFEIKPMCPHLHRQWVLCRFIAPPSETNWKNTFGSKVEWPRKGYYAPTNVALDEGIGPWDSGSDGASLTDMVIKMAANDRAKTAAQWDAEGNEIVEKRDAAIEQLRNDKIDDALYTPFGVDHIEGKRGGSVSIGGIGPDTVHGA